MLLVFVKPEEAYIGKGSISNLSDIVCSLNLDIETKCITPWASTWNLACIFSLLKCMNVHNSNDIIFSHVNLNF